MSTLKNAAVAASSGDNIRRALRYLRIMWHPVNADFFVPQLPVSIVSLPDSGGRATPLRGVLESVNCVVLLHPVGTPTDFLKVIAQREPPRYLIIVGHAEPEGFWFGRYSREIDTSSLRGECLPPDVVRQHVQLPGCTVISACCFGATEGMSEAFLSQGAQAYIGSSRGIGVELNVFLVNFFFRVLNKKLPEAQAVQEAVRATGEEAESIRYYCNTEF